MGNSDEVEVITQKLSTGGVGEDVDLSNIEVRTNLDETVFFYPNLMSLLLIICKFNYL